MVNKKVMEFIIGKMAGSMKVVLLMESNMELEFLHQQMEERKKANGRMVYEQYGLMINFNFVFLYMN